MAAHGATIQGRRAQPGRLRLSPRSAQTARPTHTAPTLAVSGATGGLEFDAFVDDSVQNAQETYNTIAGETPGGQPATLPGTDSALINPNIDGTYGAIAVRNGRFTYTISLPASDAAQTQLETLAALVLTRAQQYK